MKRAPAEKVTKKAAKKSAKKSVSKWIVCIEVKASTSLLYAAFGSTLPANFTSSSFRSGLPVFPVTREIAFESRHIVLNVCVMI